MRRHALLVLSCAASLAGAGACGTSHAPPAAAAPAAIPSTAPAMTPARNTYHVDRSHPQASDAGPGTADAPWLTIQKAADTVGAGDWVLVHAGVYEERVTFPDTMSGMADAKVLFRAEPRRSVTMWGFHTGAAAYVRMEGFKIALAPEDRADWTRTDGILVSSDGVEVIDNEFDAFQGTAITGWWHDPMPANVYVGGNRIHAPQMGLTVSGTSWLVEGNEVERLVQYGDGDCDYSRFFGEGHRIRGNHFHGAREAEIGTAHVDCFQTFDNNGEHVRNVVVEGNLCQSFHQGFMGEASFHGASSDVTFQNNVFDGGEIGGAWGLCVGQIRNVRAYHNLFVNLVYHGIGFRDGATGEVRDNIFYDAGSNYWASDGGAVTGDHNLLFSTTDRLDPAEWPSDQVADPRFVAPATGDFHLQPDSPAVDSGADVGVAYDRDGYARPAGEAPDVGPYERAP